MTRKLPPLEGKAWHSWIDEQVGAARAEGKFDELSGVGKPLPSLTGSYDPTWWVKGLLRRERVSLLPAAMEIRVKVERVLETIWQLTREEEVRSRVIALNAEIGQINRTVTSGPPTSVAVLDVDAVVQRWRERKVHG
jgi:DnaJ homologue, subfamily C, member 28, conserved domain